MGCKTKGYKFGTCSGFGLNDEHCFPYTPPSGGVTFQHFEYPQNAIRTGNYNIPARENNHVMYPYIDSYTVPSTGGSTGSGSGPAAANCGKLSQTNPCLTTRGSDSAVPTIFHDYYPTELSFDFNFSDTWFGYLYDTSNNAGIVGTPCYHIETETRTGDSGGSRQICHPCTNFTAAPKETLLSYEASQDLTGDPDCPHPTLFGIGTNSDKIVFKYNALSTTVPNSVTDFSVRHGSDAFTDAWDGSNGIAYESSQNPWQAGEEFVSDFEIYDFTSGQTKSNFIVKFRIEPIYDDSGASTVYSGTRWVLTEVLNFGTGYAVNDTFNLTFTHTHPDDTQTTLTLDLKVTAVGQTENLTGSEGFDKLRVNDTINGHTITRTFHTDDDFGYHIVYVDGNGADFTKDTQYTSNRAHVITTVAGFGIKDRAMLVGLYEFLDKSLQFITADVNQNSPDAFNQLQQPVGFITLTNGAVSNVEFGGQVISLDLNTIVRNNGYSDVDNLALTGGSGSGIEVSLITEEGQIQEIQVTNPGSGYNTGEELTIPGAVYPGNNPPADAVIRVGLAANGGSGFKNLKVAPILEISPAPEGGTDAEVEGTFTDGVLTNVVIKKPGSGYLEDAKPTLSINNIFEVNEILLKNDGHRADLVEEFQGILESIPNVSNSEVDTTATSQQIADVYAKVPSETLLTSQEPKIEIKSDPDRKRITQLSQTKFSKDATEPLKAIVEPTYDVNYLSSVPIDDEDLKAIIRDDKKRIKDQGEKNIDDITQKVYPEYDSKQESKVETCIGSFTNLPTASTYTKYLMRQYRPDPSKETSITVKLTMNPVNTGCAYTGCTPPGISSGYSEEIDTGETDPVTGDPITTTYTYSYSMSPLLGPGSKSWTATGKMKIFHDLTRGANTVTLATDAFGNPFAD